MLKRSTGRLSFPETDAEDQTTKTISWTKSWLPAPGAHFLKFVQRHALETFPHIHASLKRSTLPGVVEFNLHNADRAPSLLFDMLFTRIFDSKNIYVDLTCVFTRACGWSFSYYNLSVLPSQPSVYRSNIREGFRIDRIGWNGDV